MLIICTAVYVFFVLIDVIPIVRQKRWKTLAIYSVLITTAYIFSVLTELGIKLPSPADPLKQAVLALVGQ